MDPEKILNEILNEIWQRCYLQTEYRIVLFTLYVKVLVAVSHSAGSRNLLRKYFRPDAKYFLLDIATNHWNVG